MTVHSPTDQERAGLLFMCERCNAMRGKWCTTPSGGHAVEHHASRIHRARRLIRDGGFRP